MLYEGTIERQECVTLLHFFGVQSKFFFSFCNPPFKMKKYYVVSSVLEKLPVHCFLWITKILSCFQSIKIVVSGVLRPCSFMQQTKLIYKRRYFQPLHVLSYSNHSLKKVKPAIIMKMWVNCSIALLPFLFYFLSDLKKPKQSDGIWIQGTGKLWAKYDLLYSR